MQRSFWSMPRGGRIVLVCRDRPTLRDGHQGDRCKIPMTSLSDDVAALKAALEKAAAGPILLVSHSYSGAVITALESDDRVRGLA
jgi:pimeloyl-ACP methyl ester carboxylesterase